MARWEYRVIVLREPTLAEKEQTLDELGQEGWELVSVVNTVRAWKGHTKTEGRIERDGAAALEGQVHLEAEQRPIIAYLKRRLK